MGESFKTVCVLFLVVASLTAAVAWFDDRPDAATWSLRIGATGAAGMLLAVLLKLHFRADLAPDYLHKNAGEYFNRDGFCFAFVTEKRDGVAYLDAYYQSQRDQPCLAQIALRPAQGFFMGRSNIDTIFYRINCEPAAFGVVKMPVPLPLEVQGKKQSFEVGAAVDYPQGKGRRVRFRDGIFLRANTKFKDKLSTGLIAAGALTGQIVLSKPATTTVMLPVNVAEEIPADIYPKVETLWKLGDPPLD